MPSAPQPAEPAGTFEPREATDAEARALASGLRLRILRLTLDAALTNKEIADELGRPPASVLHHVRTLVRTGYLRAEEPRRGARGAREIPYRATGKSWYVSSSSGSSSMLDAFLSEIRSVPEDQREMARLGLRLSEEDLEELTQRLYALLRELHDRPRDPAGRPMSLFVALHPDTSTPRREG
ncbi:helix-turn-helix domain-containing protein [Ornithinimicrobium sediminis]|uniref:helix-turn-helix domain-containing protein n=1 Tax=Ornithinimicrobium sediminis TaxID=2904603 RepID=UPI001E3480B4|nr:helix-turn-helix domain-containing protein [Ornithinimicrobium sediminis]MCE0485395.1 helix-turn-helix domain-containing protein [Ornithinimicrobium sediminis]